MIAGTRHNFVHVSLLLVPVVRTDMLPRCATLTIKYNTRLKIQSNISQFQNCVNRKGRTIELLSLQNAPNQFWHARMELACQRSQNVCRLVCVNLERTMKECHLWHKNCIKSNKICDNNGDDPIMNSSHEWLLTFQQVWWGRWILSRHVICCCANNMLWKKKKNKKIVKNGMWSFSRMRSCFNTRISTFNEIQFVI